MSSSTVYLVINIEIDKSDKGVEVWIVNNQAEVVNIFPC